MTLRVFRIFLWAIVAVVAIAGAATWFKQPMPTPQQETKIIVGGAFSMTNHLGKAVTEKDYLGKPLALFFGFTYCPDICPTTLTRLTELMGKLGPDADKLQVILVSVDPERDTPEILKSYLSSFDRRFAALTGTAEQLASFAQGYRFHYEKVPQKSGDYTIDHSAGIYLYDAAGVFVGTLDPHESDSVVISKLRLLLR